MTTQQDSGLDEAALEREALSSAALPELSESVGRAIAAGMTAVLCASAFVMLAFDIPNEAVGGLVVLTMLVLLAARVPVAAAMGLSGLLGIFGVGGSRATISALQRLPFGSVSSWSLSVIPMFIFMGLMVWRSGVTERVFRGAQHWIGWMPGGLAVTTNTAGAFLAAASGSTLGISYAVGRMAIPEMLRRGYDPRLATGSVLMSGTGGQLIPPSILSVIYAGVAQVPVGDQLLAGMVPGILLVSMYGVLIVVRVKRNPALAGSDTGGAANSPSSWRQRRSALLDIWPIPFLIAIVIGGLYGGVLTATEAGAAGAFATLGIGLLYLGRAGFLSGLREALTGTVAAIGTIFLILVGAAFLTRALAMTGLARWVASFLIEANLPIWLFFLVLIGLYLILGMFLEPVAMVLITVPVFLPAVLAYGMSAMWFGAFVVLLGELALLTPPVGVLAYVVHRVASEPDVRAIAEVSLVDVFRGAWMFIPASVGLLLLLTVFPEVVEWLPTTAGR